MYSTLLQMVTFPLLRLHSNELIKINPKLGISHKDLGLDLLVVLSIFLHFFLQSKQEKANKSTTILRA